MKKIVSIAAILSVLLLNFNGCGGQEEEETLPKDKAGEHESLITEEDLAKVEIPEAEASSFAQWKDVDASYTPKIPEYTIESDLSNVQYTDIVDGPDNAKEILAQNGFVVVGDYYKEFFSLYEDNRYEYIPSFVTTDSVLHTYHLYFNFLLKSLEENELYDLVYDLTKEMQEISLQQYEELKGTEWQSAAKRNTAYFTVAMQLLDDGKSEVPEIVKEEVEAELALIAAHKGIINSPVMEIDGVIDEYLEDYSQYVPRGHYTKSEKLKRYFKAMMWYGRITFRIKKGDETRSALLIVNALKTKDDLRNNWKALYEPINFFVGESDDLVYLDYAPLAMEIFGESFMDGSFTQDYINTGLFVQKAKELRDPGINSMPVLGTILAPEEGVEERTEDVKGYRFLGQRFTIDAYVFQKLICREVGNKDGTMPCPAQDSRMLPKGLDIPSAFGSDLAYKLLDEMGETEYAKYPENMKKLQDGMAKLPKSKWTENAYWGWLYTLNALLDDYGKGYPTFMQNDEWNKKELITFLGSWAELKHDTILYAKQVYAELGGGPMIEERDDRGYVEPNPLAYARLAALTQLTIDGLSERDILSTKNAEQLDKLKELLVSLRDISIKELQNESLTDEEYELIKTFGGSLEHFWYETFTDEEKENAPSLLDDNPAPLVADVATDPNGYVLEVATGTIDAIYVVFPIDGELRIGKGGVFSYYEFPWPMSDRLTDEKWRDEIMYSEDMPDRPDWQTYIAEYE
jgi:hypothetical protein